MRSPASTAPVVASAGANAELGFVAFFRKIAKRLSIQRAERAAKSDANSAAR